MPDDASPATGAIIRTVRDRSHPYIVISRAIFEDERLGWETRGLLGYLLSKPDGWQIRFNDLLRRGNAGRERLRRMLHELQEYGYLARQRTQDRNGTFVWMYLVYETPEAPLSSPPWVENPPMEAENPTPSAGQPSVAQPPTGQPPTANPPIYRVQIVESTELESNERESAGAPAPAAPSLPAFQRFAIDANACTWWRAECQAAGLDPATIPLTTETDKWRDEIAAGRRATPPDAAADWRQWMRRAIPYALTHPPKEPTNGAVTRPPGPGARTPGQPDPNAISDEQFRADLATKLSGILVPPSP